MLKTSAPVHITTQKTFYSIRPRSEAKVFQFRPKSDWTKNNKTISTQKNYSSIDQSQSFF